MRLIRHTITALVIGLALVVSAQGVATATPVTPSAPVASVPDGWQLQMLAEVNAIRAKRGVKPLHLCPGLNATATSYASSMAQSDFFSHVAPDGTQIQDRIRLGGRKRALAENIAAGQQSVDSVVTEWRNSAGHFANMVNPQYRQVGFGVSTNGDSTFGTYWVQHFATGKRC